jgi:hypothetical protein
MHMFSHCLVQDRWQGTRKCPDSQVALQTQEGMMDL